MMFEKIIRFSVQNKLIIGLLTVALIGSGVYSALKLPIDAVPDITNNQVLVITVSPSLAAPEIERLLTFPIEQSVSNIPGTAEIRSFSRFGLSLVTIVFEDDVDVYWARQQVSERLSQIQGQIPPGIGTPELGPVTTGLGEIYQYSVHPAKGYENSYTTAQLREIQDWIIRKQLLGTKGVADVSSFGGTVKQYQVAIDAMKLKSFGIAISDVFHALESNNQNAGGAYIERGANALFIRTEGLLHSAADIEATVVRNTSTGIPVLVRDVATVSIGNAVRYGAMHQTGYGEVAGAIVMMVKGGNSSQVIANVKERIQEIQKTLPKGVVIEPFLDRTKMVNNAIGTVETNLLEGALIVIAVLVLFLGNLRAGLVVASVIPLSLLFAIILMNLFGVSGNLMSLGALDFGLIIDGAVIIVEAVMHKLHYFAQVNSLASTSPHSGVVEIEQHQMDSEVQNSASTMMNSAVFGQIIILIVYLPILSLVGIEGKMFKPMAQTVCFALIGAFVLSLTYVPMMSSVVLNKRINLKETLADVMMKIIQRYYSPSLAIALRKPALVLSATAVAFIVSVFALTQLGGEFIPELEEGDFAVDTRILTGGSLTQTVQSTTQAANLLKSRFPEVQKIVTKVGSGEIPTDPMPIEASDMMIILKDKSQWKSATTFDELADTMSKVLTEIPGLSFGFQFPVQMRFNELMTGARQDVVCKIFGEDLDSLAKYSNLVASVASTIQGATEFYVEQVTGLPQIVVTHNREQLARYGVHIQEVNNTVRAAFAGDVAGIVYEGERRFDVVLRSADAMNKNIHDIENLQITTSSGNQIPLYTVASVAIKEGPNQIQRESTRRRIVVGFNVRGRDVESVVQELQQRVASKISLPTGYTITYGGQFENLTKAKRRLAIAVPVALLLIIVLLYFAFSSLRNGLLIFTAIPLSAIGGVFALLSRSMPFSISAGVGFIALFGVAVLNGIVLIAEFNRRNTYGANLVRVVFAGTTLRLRPVLMTAAVASLGFLPMALSQGAGAEVQRPLATVVIGGLITSTFLTLIVLPLLYILAERWTHSRTSISRALPIILVVMCSSSALLSQSAPHLSIDSALARAHQFNRTIQQAEQTTRYYRVAESTSWDIPKTQFNVEYGQFNTLFNDTKFSLSQSFQLPTVYANKRAEAEAKTTLHKTDLTHKHAELSRNVLLAYTTLQYLLAKMQHATRVDSLYKQILFREQQRKVYGATSSAEEIQARMKQSQNTLHMQELALQKEEQQQVLETLLGLNTRFSIDSTFTKIALPIDTTTSTHPQIKIAMQEREVSIAQESVERSGLLPEFTLGYNNQSIRGWMSNQDNVPALYSASNRFQSVVLGVSLPLLYGAQQAKVNAQHIQTEIAEFNVQTAQTLWQKEKNKVLAQRAIAQQTIQYVETYALPQARQLQEVTTKKLQAGDISFVEWSVIVQGTHAIQTQYIDAIHQYNQQTIQAHYLCTQE